MNTLIKIIITSVIGIFGPLESEENEKAFTNIHFTPVPEILFIEPSSEFFCQFEEKLCKKLNNNI